MNTFTAIFLIWLICLGTIAILAAGALVLLRVWEDDE